MSHKSFFYKIEWSAIATLIGIILLFSTSVLVTLIAPSYLDPSWIEPSSFYQKQMYEVADPNLYISSNNSRIRSDLQFIYHIKENYTLLAFQESATVRIVAPEPLQKYITKYKEKTLKLTSDLLLLREPQSPVGDSNFNAIAEADLLKKTLQTEDASKENDSNKSPFKTNYVVLELFKPNGKEGFALGTSEGTLENWVDENFVILDDFPRSDYHKNPGVIYVSNPIEYRMSQYKIGNDVEWHYHPKGTPIETLEQLKAHELGFRSRKELIYNGEQIYATEGCWYCHSDQTRTLVQDVVLNGSEDYPAPPSAPNEYIYQEITFPATRRIGPDLSRVGVKRPNRDWHKSHFWSPKTESKGSIMPSFQHFFDNDPRGTGKTTVGIPNYKFESIYQYLMTKGTRITPPTQAWWLGKDPVKTKEIIEGRKPKK